MRWMGWAAGLIAVPLLSAGQVTGRLSVDKSIYAPGEPVFLTLTMTNEGDEPQQVSHADPYSFCSGYRIAIERQDAPHVACFRGYGGSCISGGFTLAPHASRTERVLLNFPNDSRGDLHPVVKLPGDYTVEANRTIRFAPAGGDLFRNPNQTEARGTFTVRVDGTLAVDAAVYAPYVQQLSSKRDEERRDAARTLASIAPPALEPLLLTFATSKDYVLQQYAPLALANLSTEASLAALAEMVKQSAPGTYGSMSAADYLGKTHDAKWMPVLLEVADKLGPMYLTYAAQAGGEKALPALLQRLHSADTGVRSSAIYALGNTGSRAAVPVLIALLRTGRGVNGTVDVNEAAGANAALQQLTHFYVRSTPDAAWVDEARQRWERWWFTQGRDATISLPGECVADTPLP